eukprot:4730043-Lingulodinium_polyedra.AAC.1
MARRTVGSFAGARYAQHDVTVGLASTDVLARCDNGRQQGSRRVGPPARQRGHGVIHVYAQLYSVRRER